MRNGIVRHGDSIVLKQARAEAFDCARGPYVVARVYQKDGYKRDWIQVETPADRAEPAYGPITFQASDVHAIVGTC